MTVEERLRDALNARAGQVTPDGVTQTDSYDTAGQLTGIADTTSAGPLANFSYGYDVAGRLNGLTNPYSETSAWTYRDNGWLATQSLARWTLALERQAFSALSLSMGGE